MRYRALDASGDMTFGQSQANFLVNSSAGVAQAIMTRLGLLEGEWFLDNTEGLPIDQIIGAHTQGTRDLVVRQRILDTQGVAEILRYTSNYDGTTRQFSVAAEVSTAYGTLTINKVFG